MLIIIIRQKTQPIHTHTCFCLQYADNILILLRFCFDPTPNETQHHLYFRLLRKFSNDNVISPQDSTSNAGKQRISILFNQFNINNIPQISRTTKEG